MTTEVINNNFLIDISGGSNLFKDELTLIEKFANNFMKKVNRISDYNHLKISLKSMGNTSGTHLRKIDVRLMLSKGNKVLVHEKQISTGTSDELTNNKRHEDYNVPKLVKDTFRALEIKLKSQKNKR